MAPHLLLELTKSSMRAVKTRAWRWRGAAKGRRLSSSFRCTTGFRSLRCTARIRRRRPPLRPPSAEHSDWQPSRLRDTASNSLSPNGRDCWWPCRLHDDRLELLFGAAPGIFLTARACPVMTLGLHILHTVHCCIVVLYYPCYFLVCIYQCTVKPHATKHGDFEIVLLLITE